MPCMGRSHGRDVGALPGGAEAIGFAAESDRRAAAEVGGGVEERRVGPGGEDFDFSRAEPVDGFGRAGFGDAAAEDRAQAGADHVRIEEVGAAVGDDHGVDAGGVGGSQDRAEIAGLLDAFDHGNQWLGRQVASRRAVRAGVSATTTMPSSSRSPKQSLA